MARHRVLAIFGLCAALMVAAPALTACQTPSGGGAGSGVIAGATDERAIYVAERAYNVAAKAYLAADRRGLVSAEAKAKLKPIFADGILALTIGKTALEAGDVAGAGAQAKIVTDLLAKAKPLIPPLPD